VRDVESLIKDALPTGIPSIHHIAELTAMSNRTLTRRLSEAGVTYRDLIRKMQETIAKNMLRNTAQSIGEIAFLTGFSEQSAFNKFRELYIHKWRKPITELAKVLNPKIRGLSNYYQKFWDGMMSHVWHQLNQRILKWVKWEKGLKGRAAKRWLSL